MCDCGDDESSDTKAKVQHQAVNLPDSTTEDDSEPKIEICQVEIQSNAGQLSDCDCKSEDDNNEPKTEVCQQLAKVFTFQPNADNSCDSANRVSESSSTTTTPCDCVSEEDSDGICPALKDDTVVKEQPKQTPYALVQVEVSKSMLDMKSSSESSTSCDCKSSSSKGDQDSDQSHLPSCSDKDDGLASCDCTSESSNSRFEDREKKLEWTLAIIKPEAMRFRGEIERIMEKEEGFGICQRRLLHLSAEQASEFYCDNYEQKDFARLVAYMSSKPIAVYVLSKLDAITQWRLLIGPTRVSDARIYAPDSIRAKFGTKGDEMRNAVHGSFDEREAEREIHYFFPDLILEPLLQDEAAEEYLLKKINSVLSEGLVKCCDERPEDPVTWLGNWLLDSQETGPKYLLRSTSNL